MNAMRYRWAGVSRALAGGVRARLNAPGAARLAAHLRTPLFLNAYALTASAAASSGLGLVYWTLAARAYPPETVGLNSAAVAALLLLAGVAQLSLNNVLVRYLPVAGRAASRLVAVAYLVCAVTAGGAALVFGLGLDWWAPALRPLATGPGWLAAFVLACAGWCVFSLQDSVLVGLRRAAWVPLENAAFSAAKVGLLALWAGALPLYGIFASWTAPALALLLPMNLLIFLRLIPAHRRESGAQAAPIRLREMMRFASGNFLGSLFFLAATNLMPLVVTQLAGPADNAYFYPPWMIATSLQLVALNMATSLTVEGALDERGLTALYLRALAQTARLLAPLVVVLLAGAPLLLRFFGPDYASEGTQLLRLLGLSLLPNVAVSLALGVARARSRAATVAGIQGALCVLLLGLSSLWLPGLGIAGVGWAALATQSLVAAAVVLNQLRVAFRRSLPRPEGRAPEQLRQHYEVERELAARLRNAPAERRRALYKTVYDERLRCLPHHPLLVRARDPQARARAVAPQWRLISSFVTPETVFLEIGPGDGALALAVAAHARQVYAVDVSDGLMLNGGGQPPNMTLILSDGIEIPAPREGVHLAYSNQVMEHLHPDDAQAQLRSLYAALAPGGAYLCITPNRLSGPWDISRHFDSAATGLHLREYTVGELAGALRAAGFDRVRVFLSYAGYVVTPLLPAAPVAWFERALQAAPRGLRRRAAHLLTAVKVVGFKGKR